MAEYPSQNGTHPPYGAKLLLPQAHADATQSAARLPSARLRRIVVGPTVAPGSAPAPPCRGHPPPGRPPSPAPASRRVPAPLGWR